MKKYRPNAGIVVFRDDGKVLLCQRKENHSKNWQFPQGGIDDGETPLQAAVRELREETSVTSVRFVSALEETLRYEFPDDVKRQFAARGIFNDGQEQHWQLFFFEGEDCEINLQTKEPEFQAYQWIDIEKAPELVVDFKHHIYVTVVREFAQRIRDYLA